MESKTLMLSIGQPLSVFRFDPDIETPEAAEIGVKTILGYGIAALLNDKAFSSHLDNLPEPNDDEHPIDYATRVQESLLAKTKVDDRDKIRATIIDLGMDRGDTQKHLLAVGRRLLAWRVYIGDATLAGVWQYSPSGANDYGEWLATVTRDVSKAERSRLRISIKALAWIVYDRTDLGGNLPENHEEVFLPGQWNKWAITFAAVWKRKLYLDDQANQDAEAEITSEIEDLLEKALDPETTLDGMGEAIKEKSSAKPLPIDVRETQKDPDTEMYMATMIYNPTQRAMLQKHPLFKLLLEGETYDTTEMVSTQYRKITDWVCLKCGEIYPYPSEHCPTCGQFDSLQEYCQWATRTWNDGEWSDWTDHKDEEPERKGHFVSRLADRDLGHQYLTYVEERIDS